MISFKSLRHALLMSVATFGSAGTVAAIAQPAYAQEVTRTYSIQAQDLNSALREFAMQTGRDVLYPPEIVAGRRSPGVQGQMTERQALEALLAGSGLRFEQTASNGYAVQDPNSPTRLGDANGAAPSEEDPGYAEILVVGQRTLNTDIRRTEDDMQPYVVFDAEEIERSGAATAEEFLRTRLPMNTQVGSFGQLTRVSEPATTGFGQFDLRGLGSAQTLVLVDGRRPPSAPTIGGDFFQPVIDGIPASAIERIEILPATAGGVYGGNATGGVINVILKRNYSGLDVEAQYGRTFDAEDGLSRLNLTGGFGFGSDRRTRITFSASHAEGEPFYASERDFAQRSRALIIANNPSDIFAPFTIPSGATTNFCAGTLVFGSFPSCNGTMLVLDNGTPFNASLGSVPSGYAGPGADGGAGLLPGAGAYNLEIADFGEALLRTPTADALSVDVRQELTDQVEAYFSVRANRTESSFAESGRFITGSLPAADPNNPFQQSIVFNQPVHGVPRSAEIVAENYQVLGGAILRLPHNWSVMLEHAWSGSSAESVSGGGAGVAGANAARQFALQDGAAHPYDLSAFVFPPRSRTSPVTSAQSTNIRASGPLIDLPAGSVAWTLALEHRQEELEESIQDQFNAGTGLINYRFYPPAERDVTSAYLEARIPLISRDMGLPLAQSLEVLAAVRQDEYDVHADPSYDSTSLSPNGPFATPVFLDLGFRSENQTLGLEYTPFDGLTFRASHSTGFLPPFLRNSGSPLVDDLCTAFCVSFVYAGILDPRRGNTPLTGDPANGGRIVTTTGGNPDLVPEESESWSFGVVLEPHFLEGLRVSLDYVETNKTNEILNFLDDRFLIEHEADYPNRVTRGPNLPGDPPGWAGPIVGLDTSSLNIAQSSVRAIDAQIDYEWETTFGAFHAYALITQQSAFERQHLPTSPVVDFVGYVNGPLEWKGNGGLLWLLGNWTAGWNAQFYDEYSVRLAESPTGSNSNLNVLRQGSEAIPAQVYHDLSLAYRFNDDRSQVRLGVQNVLDESPPITAYNGFSSLGQFGTYSGYGDPRMRRFTLAVRHTF